MMRVISTFGDFVEDVNQPGSRRGSFELICCTSSLAKPLNRTALPRGANSCGYAYGLEDGRVYTLEEVGQTIGGHARACPAARSASPQPAAPVICSCQVARLSVRGINTVQARRSSRGPLALAAHAGGNRCCPFYWITSCSWAISTRPCSGPLLLVVIGAQISASWRSSARNTNPDLWRDSWQCRSSNVGDQRWRN